MAKPETLKELLLERLRGGHGVLRKLAYVSMYKSTFALTLRLFLPSIDCHTLLEIEEALGMLAMLREIDSDAWATQMREIWPGISKCRVDGALAGGPEAWGVRLVVNDEDAYSVLHDYHRQRQESGQSADYQYLLDCFKHVSDAGVRVGSSLGDSSPRSEAPQLKRMAETYEMYRHDDPATILYVAKACVVWHKLHLGVEELDAMMAFHRAGSVFQFKQFGSWS